MKKGFKAHKFYWFSQIRERKRRISDSAEKREKPIQKLLL